MLDPKAVFHDMTAEYMSPAECEPGDTVMIRLRTGKGEADRVELLTVDGAKEMGYEQSDDDFDYYRLMLEVTGKTVAYWFRITSGVQIRFYDRRGVSPKAPGMTSKLTFRLIPGFHTPDWAKGAVMYQIFTDRFCNGDKTNDVLTDEYHYLGKNVHQVKNWDRLPDAVDDGLEFYGGDLQGVLDKMDYLQELGIEVIYFNPLFCSPSSHKYDTQDYDHIDPHFGRFVTDEGKLLPKDAKDNSGAGRYIRRVTDLRNLEASDKLFCQVVTEAHRRGMRVILDGVFNHCGSFNKWMDRERIYENAPGYAKGAYVSKESPYHDYFTFHKRKWPYNANYDGWWDYDTLPKLNYEASEELCEYILQVGRKWVSAPYNADGWRLDVAADLGHSGIFNHNFWKRFRKAVKEANPNAIILAENYGPSGKWLQGDEWDTVMNYDAFMEPLTFFLTGMEKHSDEYHPELEGDTKAFWKQMIHAGGGNFSEPSLYVAMNELSNHDHSRFLTRTNHITGRVGTHGNKAADRKVLKEVMREAVAVQMTWPGAPTLYYGDEAGVCGFTDPDNRRTYPWGHEDQEMISFHKDMIRIHRENEELKTGSLLRLQVKADKNVLAYGRFNHKAACIVAVNNNICAVTEVLDVHYLGIARDTFVRQLLISTAKGYETTAIQMEVRDGKLTLDLPARSAVVLKYVKKETKGPEYVKYRFAEFT